jgi:hypothetical protein
LLCSAATSSFAVCYRIPSVPSHPDASNGVRKPGSRAVGEQWWASRFGFGPKRYRTECFTFWSAQPRPLRLRSITAYRWCPLAETLPTAYGNLGLERWVSNGGHQGSDLPLGIGTQPIVSRFGEVSRDLFVCGLLPHTAGALSPRRLQRCAAIWVSSGG